jgi:uncharacterized membrane protein YvbJ
MPLKPCRECGANVSKEAQTCPHCGAPHPTKDKSAAPDPITKTSWLMIAGIAFILTLLAIFTFR